MISLTNDQRNRLMNAASKLRMDERAKLSLGASQVVADQIDKVLYELHMENPQAFVTSPSLSLGGPEFIAVHSLVKRRKFYDEPLRHSVEPNQYTTFTRSKNEPK